MRECIQHTVSNNQSIQTDQVDYKSLKMFRLAVLMGFLTVVDPDAVLGADPQLRLVNVLFRHGDRAPSVHETFPKDKYAHYNFSPISRGDLTNGGKRRVYQLGQVLRSRYDDFLGPYYTPAVVEARSTYIDRAKMSLQLVLAALFPPTSEQIWNEEILWQPIPIIYQSSKQDHVLRPKKCPQYGAEFKRVKNRSEVKQQTAKFKGLSKTLGKYTGKQMNEVKDLYHLYLTFSAQNASGLELPKWAYHYWPNGQLLNATVLHYQTRNYNDIMKRLNGGILLKKIVDDAKRYRDGKLEKGRRLFLYSAHEGNIVSLQSALGVYEPHVPAYSSAVIIELWELDEKYFFKVLYYKGIPSEIVTQKIPGCSELCPMDKFLKLLKPVTATESDLKCH